MNLLPLLLLTPVITGAVALGAENPCYSLATCKYYVMRNFTIPGAPVDGAFTCSPVVADPSAPNNPLLGSPVVNKVNALENSELSNGYSYGTPQTFTYLPVQCGVVKHTNALPRPAPIPGQPQRPTIPIYKPYFIPNPVRETDAFGNLLPPNPAIIQMPCGYYYQNTVCPPKITPGT